MFRVFIRQSESGFKFDDRRTLQFDVLHLVMGNRMSFGVTMAPNVLEQQERLMKSQSFYKRRKLKTLCPSSAHLSPLNGSLFQKEPLTFEVSARLQ